MLIKMLTMIMLYLQYVFMSNQTYQIPHTGMNTCLVVKVYCNSGVINPAIEVMDTVRDGKHGISLANNTPDQNDIFIDEEETEVTNMINECLNSENFVSVVDTLIRQQNNEQDDVLCVPSEPETYSNITYDKSSNSVDKTASPSKQLEGPSQLTSASKSCSSSHKLIQHIKKKNLKSAKDRKMRQKVQEMINERIKVDHEQDCISADDEINTDAGLTYEHKEKYFKRWDEILLAKGDKRLINLFNNLKLSYQPEKQKSFIDFIKNTAKFSKTFNGYNFQYKVISGYRIDDIMEVIGKPKMVTNVWNILLDDDEDKAFTYEELSSKICVDINYYIAAVKHKCFNIHANGNYLLPKISIYNIIEFVPEFFCYFIYKIFCIKNVKYTTEFGYHLKSELDNVYKLLERFDCFCNKPICTELTRLLMINEFRKNVLTYLKNYHNDDTVWIVYELCTIAAHEEHLKSVSGSLFLCLSLCFTFDFTPAKASLQTFYRKICIKKRSVVKTKMVRIYLGTKLLGFRSIAESALFTLIEMQEQNLELLFGHKNTTRIYLPNNDFVLFVNIDSVDSAKTEVYAIRKHELGVILLHGNLQFAPGLISPC